MAKKTSILSLIVLGSALWTLPASADLAEQDGYVCSAAYVPANGSGMSPSDNKGRLGYVTFDVYSGPHCSGRHVTTGYFCSVGATSRQDCYPFAQVGEAAALAQKEASLLNQGARGHLVTVYAARPDGPVVFVRSFAH
ncbi:MAG: hypothetical protein AAGF92_05770 [Myxococcota bacterium]